MLAAVVTTQPRIRVLNIQPHIQARLAAVDHTATDLQTQLVHLQEPLTITRCLEAQLCLDRHL